MAPRVGSGLGGDRRLQEERWPATCEGPITTPHAVSSSCSCSPDDRDACHACTRNSSARKATSNASSGWTQGFSNPEARRRNGRGFDLDSAGAPIRPPGSGGSAAPRRRCRRQGQREGVSTQRGAHQEAGHAEVFGYASPSTHFASGSTEPGEAEHDQADAPRDDRAVHEGFEVLASVEPLQEESEERTNEEPTNAAPGARAPPTRGPVPRAGSRPPTESGDALENSQRPTSIPDGSMSHSPLGNGRYRTVTNICRLSPSTSLPASDRGRASLVRPADGRVRAPSASRPTRRPHRARWRSTGSRATPLPRRDPASRRRSGPAGPRRSASSCASR